MVRCMRRESLLHRCPALTRLPGDNRGAVLVEAALVLPILAMFLLGIATYGGWFMAAHSLQQASNDAARAAIAGMDADERRALVDSSIARSVIQTGTLDAGLVTVTTSEDAGYYAVSLRYDVARSGLFSASLVPLPGDAILRTAVVRLSPP